MVFRLTFVYLFIILVVPGSCLLGRRDDTREQIYICDNGVVGIEKDFSSETTDCRGDRIDLQEYLEPAGESFCQFEAAGATAEGGPVCMEDDITYSGLLPMSGDYRPLPPKYGEYSYLPPQRWLHALKYGAIAFLYHPCASLEHIMELKRLATSCLRKHVITPYPHLGKDKPLAMVSWGCSYIMSWVDRAPAMKWIQEHALKTVESIVTADGSYDYGLIVGANFLNESVICPVASNGNEEDNNDNNNNNNNNKSADYENTTVTTGGDDVDMGQPTVGNIMTAVVVNAGSNSSVGGISSNCSGDTHCILHQNHVVVVLHNYPVLTGLIVLMALVVFTLAFFLFWVYCFRRESSSCAVGSRKRQLGRYKQCGQFYRGGDKVVGIAIPELGLPKTVPSEREKLLLDSDEDDL